MISHLRARLQTGQLRIWSIVALVLIGAAVFGFRSSPLWLASPLAVIGAFALLQKPILGLVAIVAATLFVRLEIDTGTAVVLNPVTLLVPALLAIWFLDMMRRGEIRLAASRVNRPLLLFILAGLLSLVVGLGTWDPAAPRSGSFLLVQLAQWAICAFSAVAFWLTGNLVPDLAWLRRLAFFFLALAGGVAIARTFVGLAGNAQLAQFVGGVTTSAREQAPFWMLLTALSTGQLLFNQGLTARWRAFLWVVLAAVAVYVLHLEQQTASNWAGVIAVLGVLAWLRWPRLRWPVILLLVVLALSGTLSSAVYEFAGGEDEWVGSGGSRLVLIGRVLEVTMRNPITGLGPAAYRLYAMEPLLYGRAYWVAPRINSHNNYVDLFSQGGLLGLALFCWFAVEVARLGLRLRAYFTHQGFAAGYVNGMLAAGAASLVLMVFADWILPFVYNIGFPGFQASVLVWLFLGGLVALEKVAGRQRNGLMGDGVMG